MAWTFGLTDLAGVSIGAVENAYERKLNLPLNGLPTASFRIRLDDPLAGEITSRNGDCFVKVYQDEDLVFIGEITDTEEIGAGGFYKRVTDRKGMLNVGYVLPTTWDPGTTPVGEIAAATDTTSIAARGQFEGVIPADFPDPQLRQALANAHVERRKIPREIITFDPSATGDTEGTLAVNVAGPLWRLSFRHLGIPYPSAAQSWTGTANAIIDAWINQTNTNADSGIRLGTRDTLHATSIGTDPAESSYIFKPVSEALTALQEAKIAFPIDSPLSWIAFDSFVAPTTHTAMTGRADDLTNVWTAVGDAEDWHMDGDLGGAGVGYGYRGATPQISAYDVSGYRGRWMIAGTANASAVLVGADYRMAPAYASGNSFYFGPHARHNGLSPESGTNGDDAWIWAYADLQANVIAVDMKLANQTPVTLQTYPFPSGGLGSGSTYRMRLLIDDDGNYTVWHYASGAALDAPKIVGQHAALATGGALATGKVGFHGSITLWTAASNIDVDAFLASNYTGAQSFDFEIVPTEPTVDASGYPGTLPYIGVLNVRTQIGTSKPQVIFEPGRTPEFGPDYDYIVGDYITARARKSATESWFNATFRINGVQISVDDNGKATVIPELVPQ